jgi:ribonuclease HI
MGTWISYSDGASRGNPGPSGCGVFMTSPDGDEFEAHRYLNTKTNNQAEYEALLLACEELLKHKAKDVVFRADSEFMIKQMRGEYRVKDAKILPLYLKAKELCAQFKSVKFEHVRREFNKDADRLANLAIDKHEASEL